MATILIVLTVLVLLAVLAPVLGADTRRLDRSDASDRDKLWARRA